MAIRCRRSAVSPEELPCWRKESAPRRAARQRRPPGRSEIHARSLRAKHRRPSSRTVAARAAGYPESRERRSSVRGPPIPLAQVSSADPVENWPGSSLEAPTVMPSQISISANYSRGTRCASTDAMKQLPGRAKTEEFDIGHRPMRPRESDSGCLPIVCQTDRASVSRKGKAPLIH